MTHGILTDAQRAQMPAANCYPRHVDRTADDWGTSEAAPQSPLLWTRVEWTAEWHATTFSMSCWINVMPVN